MTHSGKNRVRSRETKVEFNTSQKGEGTRFYLWPLAILSLFTIIPSKHAVKEEKATQREDTWKTTLLFNYLPRKSLGKK